MTTAKFLKVFLREWILDDISKNIDLSQYGGLPGTGTEHMMVCLVDRILEMLDSTTDSAAVIAAMVDWKKAFDSIKT